MTRIGSVELTNPVMTASGTAGYGTELAAYLDLSSLGRGRRQVARRRTSGRATRRRGCTRRRRGCSTPSASRGRASRTGSTTSCPTCCAPAPRSSRRSGAAASTTTPAPPTSCADAPPEVVAVEVNLSCPNLEGRSAIFAHDPELSAAAITATAGCGRPRWAKLSANTDRIVDVAGAVAAAGAEAVTCINTLLGLAYDRQTRQPALGAGGGGLSGPAIHPVAVRAVHDVHAAHPDLPIVGVGGVASGWDAAELLLAGASAVQVGTATFADPRAPAMVLADLRGHARPLSAGAPSTGPHQEWDTVYRHGYSSAVDS